MNETVMDLIQITFGLVLLIGGVGLISWLLSLAGFPMEDLGTVGIAFCLFGLVLAGVGRIVDGSEGT